MCSKLFGIDWVAACERFFSLCVRRINPKFSSIHFCCKLNCKNSIISMDLHEVFSVIFSFVGSLFLVCLAVLLGI